MNEQKYQGAVERLQAVNKVIEGLDPAIRADAFKLLEPYITGTPVAGRTKDEDVDGNEGGPPEALDLAAFFTEHGGNRPDQNVVPIAAVLYSRMGAEPFTKQDIAGVADEVGITLPDRPDKVLKNAKEGPNKMFKSAGYGKLQPTVTGETALQATYGVKKLARKKPASEE